MPSNDHALEEALLALEAGIAVIQLAHQSTDDPEAEQALSTALVSLATGHALVTKNLDNPEARQEPRRDQHQTMGQQEPEEACLHPDNRIQDLRGNLVCLDCATTLTTGQEEPEEQQEGCCGGACPGCVDPETAARIADCPNPEVHGNPFRYCACGWIEPASGS